MPVTYVPARGLVPGKGETKVAVVNAYSVVPNEIKPGDEMLFVVKAVVSWKDEDGCPRYRIYKCPWEGAEQDIPQGSHVSDHKAACKMFFPSLAAVGKPG